MIWRLKELLWHNALREVERESGSGRWTVWISDRPLPGPFILRVKAAWLVLTGKADALTWPDESDPSSWCAIVAPSPEDYARGAYTPKDDDWDIRSPGMS